MAVIISVSLTQEQKTFLDEMELSASSLLQSCIMDKIESNKVNARVVRDMQNRVNAIRENLEKMSKFINDQGLMDKWLQTNGF